MVLVSGWVNECLRWFLKKVFPSLARASEIKERKKNSLCDQGPLSNCSGLAYAAVTPATVSLFSLPLPQVAIVPAITRLTPKSQTLALLRSLPLRSTFAGLRSLCVTRCAWRCASAAATSAPMRRTREYSRPPARRREVAAAAVVVFGDFGDDDEEEEAEGLDGEEEELEEAAAALIASASDPPSTSSSTRQIVGGLSDAAYSETTCGCLGSEARIWISRAKVRAAASEPLLPLRLRLSLLLRLRLLSSSPPLRETPGRWGGTGARLPAPPFSTSTLLPFEPCPLCLARSTCRGGLLRECCGGRRGLRRKGC